MIDTDSRNTKAFAAPLFASIWLFMLSAICSQAALYNLTQTLDYEGAESFTTSAGTVALPFSTYQGPSGDTYGASINGGIFVTSKTGSGTGAYRSLYKLGGSSTSDGYNRPKVKKDDFESSVIGGDSHMITVGDLVVSGGYIQFSFDINETGKTPGAFISLDELQLYVGASTDPGSLPTTSAGLGDLGAKIWDLQGDQPDGTRNQILLAGSGSGADELSFYVPASLFDGFTTDQQVYLYSMTGDLETAGAGASGVTYTGFATDAGFSEWSTIKVGDTFTLSPALAPALVPELSSPLALLCLLAVRAVTWRSRPRRLPLA